MFGMNQDIINLQRCCYCNKMSQQLFDSRLKASKS